MAKETSKANIRKAQDTRRLIGVVKFIFKLKEYQGSDALWVRVVELFDRYGFEIRVKK